MKEIIKKSTEIIKNQMRKTIGYTKMITDYTSKAVESAAKYAPKTMAVKIFADNFHIGSLLAIAIMALFTKIDRRILKVLFSVSFIGKVVGDKIMNKHAEKEAIENMSRSIQGWTIHDWIQVLNNK